MKKDDILSAARERLDEAYSAEFDNRELAADDLNFLVGDQWPQEVREEREAEGKPCLTVNALPQYSRQVTGQIRDMNPAIKVMPADGTATPEVAEIYEGLIRQIEYQSDAASIYEAAGEQAANCGIGHWRVLAEYCGGDTFDQEVILKRIPNPFAVFWDPSARMSTREDAEWCLICTDIPRKKFREDYPKAKEVDITGDNKPGSLIRWVHGDNVTVAEYFWKEYETHEIGLMSDGTIVRDPQPPMNFERKRTVTVPVVKWAKVSGMDVLEGPMDFPSAYIPVVAVTGEEINLGETLYRSSVIRFAKDAQQLYNYARSAQAELIALQPKAPFIGTAKQFAGLEKFWNEANKSNRPYLPYNPDPAAPGAPQRQTPPVSSQGLMSEMQLAAEDMKRTTGIYDASLGAKSNETSGIAIRQRQAESQNSTSVYADNVVKAVNHTGRILVDMIPRVYDTRRVIQILNEDDSEKMVEINQLFQTVQGLIAVNDLTTGKYGVRVSVGPNYATKRQEASDGMMQFLQAVPNAGPMIADLIAKAQEWPDADQIAERLKATLPPGLAEEEGDEGQQVEQMIQQRLQQILPQMQQEMQQQMMQSPEMRKAEAEAAEAEADAQEAMAKAEQAKVDAQRAQVELAILMRQAATPEVAPIAPQGAY